MKDKFTYDLIEGLDESEFLELDFEMELDEKELENINIDTEKIRNKTYEKIGNTKIKKYKNKKIINLVASILLMFLIGTPVALAFVNQLYKYDKSSGSIIKSDEPILVLKEPITKKVGDGEITLSSVVINTESGKVSIEEECKNLVEFEYSKRDILDNGKKVTDDTFSKTSKTYSMSYGNYVDYDDSHKYEYVISLMDKEKQITKVNFELDLEEATSVEKYNENLSKDTKHNIVVSAITKEDKNYLYAELMAIPGIDKFDFSVDHYGNHINDNKGSNIFLIDARGNKVEGEYYRGENKQNMFRFNTEGLVKPFTLKIDEIMVSNTSNEGVKINLPKLKFGEAKELNKAISLEDKNNLLTKENHDLVIKKVERKNLNKTDTYVIHVEYPKNKESDMTIKNLSVHPGISWFGFGQFYFSGTAQDAQTDGYKAKIKISLQDMGDEEYTGRDKLRTIKFKATPGTYLIKGPWELNI